MNSEIVHPLFRLLDQRVAEDLPGQVLRHAVDLLQGLVDGNGPDRYGRIAHDPLAGFVDIVAGGQVHYCVAAPAS